MLPCQLPCHPAKRTDLSASSHVWSHCWESHLLLQLTAPETRPIQQLHKSSRQASSGVSSSWQHMAVLLPPPVNASIMPKVNTSSPTVNSTVTRHSAAQWFNLCSSCSSSVRTCINNLSGCSTFAQFILHGASCTKESGSTWDFSVARERILSIVCVLTRKGSVLSKTQLNVIL